VNMTKQTTCPHCEAVEIENARLRDQLATWDPVFAIRRALPSDEEAGKLLKIVCGRYPHMKEQNTSERQQVQNFLCSLAYVSSLTVSREAVTKYSGGWWIGEAETARMPGRPRALLPGIIVSDVPFMLSNDQLFLDPFRSKGTAVDLNAWRRLLAGGELRAAIPILPKVDDRSIGFRKVLAETW
jgi:hypothetical protein